MKRPLRAIAAILALGMTLALVPGVTPSALAQSPAPVPMPSPGLNDPPPPPPPAPPNKEATDPFGEELMLASKTIVYLKGSGTWDNAYETLIDAFKSVYAFLDKQGIKRAGPSMTIYTSADDTGFQFQAAVPVAEDLRDPPRGDIEVGKSPAGRALKFVHRGSYDSMDNTYEAITNHLDEKRLEAQDVFVEEYETDPVTTPEDKLVVNVYVPIK